MKNDLKQAKKTRLLNVYFDHTISNKWADEVQKACNFLVRMKENIVRIQLVNK
jgi:acyl carrier protein phosphodiesterase